ncbi:hypothetical protein FRC06_003973 [Ceratobasidium sp. 370]|nr:hypothetical protein FRC06_003973 [Ceratobasidium sp. 370]
MYQSPQTSYTQPPAPTHQHSQSQSWHPPAAPPPPPRPTESQHAGPAAPPLPPKPELRSISTDSFGSWSNSEVVNSSALQNPSHYWPPHPPTRTDSPGMGHRAYASSMISSASAPRIGGAIPHEQVRLLDSARFTELEQAASLSHPQQMTIGQSPEMGPYALVPPTPQMRGVTPMPQSPYLSPAPRVVEGSSPPQTSASPLFKSSPQSSYGSSSPMLPPPPPPLANRPYAATPALPDHGQLPPHPPHLPPPPPPLPTHHSEPQPHPNHSHTPDQNSSRPRHLSLPPLPPSTPFPSHPPSSTSTPGVLPPPAMPVPSFPQPFAAPSAPMHTGSQSWDPPLPPKEPIPPLFPTASAAGGSSPRLSPPLPHTTTLEEQHEAELREAVRMSLAISPRSEEEDPELAQALRESMRETSIRSAGLGSNPETGTGLNLGSGAWTPELPRAESPEAESVYQTRPPPPLPSQAQIATPATPAQEVIPETPAIVSPATEAQTPDEDEPPPPTYEEVTGSQTATPAVVPSVPLLSTMSEPDAPILGSVSPRERNTRNNVSEPHSSLNMSVSAPEPPVAIEVIPPNANNSLGRREPRPGRLERSSSEGDRPACVSDEISTGTPSRRSTQSPSRSTVRPRASSQSRPRPSAESPQQPEPTILNSARPRVTSASLASSSPVSRLSRASMFFGMSGSSLSLGSNEPPPRRTWAIDEEPGPGNGLLLQAPEPPLSLLRSRNASEVNLNEGLADAPPSETLLNGVIYGFRDPDPPTPVPMPAADPPPPNISLDDSGAFYIQTLNFRHLLRLLSHYGSTSLMATPAAIAASKSGVHSTRVVLHFVRGPHERDPWFCRLFLELHTTPERETTSPPDTTLPHPGTKIIAPVGPRGKLYVVPGPLPQLPLSFQGLSIFLINRLEEARRAPSDSSQRRLERILVECYGSVTGAGVTSEEIGGRQKGSGNLRSLGGIFSKVKDKLSSDKPNGNVNDHTFDLISPFHLEDYPLR